MEKLCPLCTKEYPILQTFNPLCQREGWWCTVVRTKVKAWPRCPSTPDSSPAWLYAVRACNMSSRPFRAVAVSSHLWALHQGLAPCWACGSTKILVQLIQWWLDNLASSGGRSLTECHRVGSWEKGNTKLVGWPCQFLLGCLGVISLQFVNVKHTCAHTHCVCVCVYTENGTMFLA